MLLDAKQSKKRETKEEERKWKRMCFHTMVKN